MFIRFQMEEGKVEYINSAHIQVVGEQDGKIALLITGSDIAHSTEEPFDGNIIKALIKYG